MDFDYTTETIIPDNTGILTIGGDQGIELPVGSSAQRPGVPEQGVLRFNTDNNFKNFELYNGDSWQSVIDTVVTGDMFSPSGFVDSTHSTINFNPSTQTFTITPTATSFTIYIAGKRLIKTTESITVPNTTGQYLFYYDVSGTLQYTTATTLPSIITIAVVIYIATPTPTILAFSDQRHGIKMDSATADYLSNTQGVAYVNGLDITGYTTTGSGSSDVDAQISITDGLIYSADIPISIINNATPSAPYQQILNGPAQIPMAYVITTGQFGGSSATTFPVQQGTSRIQYANFNGSTYNLVDADEGYFVASWIVAANSYYSPVTGLVGIHQSSTLQQALADNSFDDLKAMFGSSALIGIRPLYCLIYETSSSYSNTPHAALRIIIDFRAQPIVGTLDHSALSGLGEDDHPNYVSIINDRTITAQHTFNPSTDEAPFLLGSNAQNQLVVGLNADQLDGHDASYFQPANENLSALAGIPTTGIYVITGSGTSTTRNLTSSGSTLIITNSSGVAGNINVDLNTVGTPVINSFVKITTNAYGQVTATTDVLSSDITTSLGYTPVNKAGDTMSGVLDMSGNTINNLASPSTSNQAATKGYVDSLSTGLIWQPSIKGNDLISDSGGPPSSPLAQDAYIIGTGDNTGAWSGFSVGDVVEWNGSAWSKIATAAIGQRYGINFTTTTTTSGSFSGKKDTIVTITGGTAGSWTYSFATPANNWAVNNNNTNSIDSGTSFVYSTTLSEWVLFSSSSQVMPGSGLYYSPATTLNVGTASSSRIVVNSTNIDLATTGVSAGTYEKVTVDVYGRVTSATQLTLSDITTALGYTPQQQSSNLTALSTTPSTGIYVITGSGTSDTRTIVVPSGMSITNPDGVAGDPTIALTTNLLGIENISTNGLIAYSGSNTFSSRSLIAPSEGITISNPNGVSGNPTFALANDLGALEGLSTTGFASRFGTSQWITRTISGTTNQITAINGDGVSGNPVLSIPTVFVAPGSIEATTIFKKGTLSYTDTNIFSAFQNSQNSYVQTIIQNTNNGNTASSDYIVSNDQGSATTFYGDFGMNSSGFVGDGPLEQPNVVYLTSTSGDLVIGTTTANAIDFVINDGTTAAFGVGTLGQWNIVGDPGLSNQVFTSGGSSAPPSWQSLSSLSVTSFSAGTTGLTPNTASIGTVTLGGTLALSHGGTNANLTAVNGGVVYSTGSAMAITPAGTVGQILTSNGTSAPSWGNVAGSAYTAIVTPATLVSGNYYSSTITHNLGTNNICITVYDNSTQSVIIPHALVQTDTNNLTITVIGNTRTYRVVVIANGSSIQAGGSTPSSIIVQNQGVTLSGSPFTVVNLASGLTATNTGSGVATITPSSTSVIKSLSFFATSMDSPNNSDWAVNSLAPTIADPTNNAINVRQFDNTTEEGVGILLPVPSGATNVTFTYKGRAQTAQGSAQNLQMRLYIRSIPNNAAVGSWSSANNLDTVSVPSNAYVQYFSTTVTLSSLSLSAGNLYQVELTRNVSVSSNLATPFLLSEFTVSFT